MVVLRELSVVGIIGVRRLLADHARHARGVPAPSVHRSASVGRNRWRANFNPKIRPSKNKRPVGNRGYLLILYKLLVRVDH